MKKTEIFAASAIAVVLGAAIITVPSFATITGSGNATSGSLSYQWNENDKDDADDDVSILTVNLNTVTASKTLSGDITGLTGFSKPDVKVINISASKLPTAANYAGLNGFFTAGTGGFTNTDLKINFTYTGSITTKDDVDTFLAFASNLNGFTGAKSVDIKVSGKIDFTKKSDTTPWYTAGNNFSLTASSVVVSSSTIGLIDEDNVVVFSVLEDVVEVLGLKVGQIISVSNNYGTYQYKGNSQFGSPSTGGNNDNSGNDVFVPVPDAEKPADTGAIL
jgi:hypothetical protein